MSTNTGESIYVALPYHVTSSSVRYRISQNSKASNPAHDITAPPASSGDKTFRTIPPMWNNGIMFRQTSLQSCVDQCDLWIAKMISDMLKKKQLTSLHELIMQATPTTNASRLYGTSFLLPEVPDVCNSRTISGCGLRPRPESLLTCSCCTSVWTKVASCIETGRSNAMRKRPVTDSIHPTIIWAYILPAVRKSTLTYWWKGNHTYLSSFGSLHRCIISRYRCAWQNNNCPTLRRLKFAINLFTSGSWIERRTAISTA